MKKGDKARQCSGECGAWYAACAKHREPEEEGGAEEAHIFERMDELVLERGLEERRSVPQPEGEGVDDSRGDEAGEEYRSADERTADRMARQPGDRDLGKGGAEGTPGPAKQGDRRRGAHPDDVRAQ